MERDHVQRLADLMDQRRVALRLRWEDVADEAGISTAFLRKIRSGQTASPLTLAKLETALGWAPGSISAILGGGVPTEAAPPTHAAPAGSAGRPATAEEAEAAIRELARAVSPERLRAILTEAARQERRFEDDADQHLWETPGLPERHRRFLIYQLEALRKAEDGTSTAHPGADVREFRTSG